VIASGSPPLTHQWLKNSNNLSNAGNISGATTNNLILENVFVNDPGYYQVAVSNAFGAVISSNATLTVSNLPFEIFGNLAFKSQQFQLTLVGPVGSNVVIYANTNLATQNWVPLETNSLTIGSFIFTDALASNYPSRFYRAKLWP
jgi:hypothetical protein